MAYIDPLNPMQRSRVPYLFLQYGLLEVVDGALALSDAGGTRVQIPVGALTALFLEPGVTVTHAAVCLAGSSGTQIFWVGEAANRTYCAGRSVSGDVQRLLHQTRSFHDEPTRLRVVHNMFRLRFQEEVPSRRSVEQLRGMEGARVRAVYKNLATIHRVPWQGRKYDPNDWDEADAANRALSAGNACLHGFCEAVILACGYHPSIGFVHTGGLRSFVYDIADLYKMELSAPLAFELAGKNRPNVETEMRHRLRDIFREKKLVDKVVFDIDSVLEVAPS